MILKLYQAGEPVLRQQARLLSLEELRSEEVQLLISCMRETMRDAPGVGLAAPQVGYSLALAVIEDRPEYLAAQPQRDITERGRSPVPFQVLVNPRLTVLDPTPQSFFEGCLSVSGFTALVPRASAVRVEAWNERGEEISIEAKGWPARILQHELDHLRGTLYLDRMEPRSFSSQQNHLRYWRAKTLAELRAELSLED